MTDDDCCQKILNEFKAKLAKCTSEIEIKSLFKTCAKKLHPDINKCDDKYFKELLEVVTKHQTVQEFDLMNEQEFKNIITSIANSVSSDRLKTEIEINLICNTSQKLQNWFNTVLLKKLKKAEIDRNGELHHVLFTFLNKAEKIDPPFAVSVYERILSNEIIIPKDPSVYEPPGEDGQMRFFQGQYNQIKEHIQTLNLLSAKVTDRVITASNEDYEDLMRKGLEIKNVISNHGYSHFDYDFDLNFRWDSETKKVDLPIDTRVRCIKELKLIDFDTIFKLAEQAEALFLKAHELTPSKPGPLKQLGRIFFDCLDYAKAIPYLQRALDMWPAYQSDIVARMLKTALERQKMLSSQKLITIDYQKSNTQLAKKLLKKH